MSADGDVRIAIPEPADVSRGLLSKAFGNLGYAFLFKHNLAGVPVGSMGITEERSVLQGFALQSFSRKRPGSISPDPCVSCVGHCW